ncbi:MAG: class I SAM-dependent methyltransferase [Candidatus Omnitrophota bacterium]
MNEEEFKKAVRKGFDEASAGYDKPAMRFFDNSAEHMVGGLALKGDEHILDAATGTGKVALAAARRLPKGRVTGFDLSDGMLNRAREKARENDLNNILFHSADVDGADFPPDYFDGLTCGFGVFFWTDMITALQKLIRFVKPGGFVAFTSFADGSFKPQSDLCLDRFKQYGIKMPDTYSWQRLDHPDKHRELLTTVGLNQIDSHAAPMGYYLTDALQWWDLVTYTGFRGFLNQLSEEQVQRYKTEHLEEIARTSDDQGIRLNVNVIFSIARKK